MFTRDHKTFVLLTKAYHGGVLTSGATAIGVASAILRGHYGEAELSSQQPLSAMDEGKSWLVEGSRVDPDLGGGGTWYIRLMKDDGRVVALGHRVPQLDLTQELGALQAEVDSNT